MNQVKEGSKVTIEFKGKLDNGKVFGQATAGDPLKFTIGNQEILEGMEEALLGMEPGQRKTAVIPEQKAFGPRLDNRVYRVRREKMPEEFKAEVGAQINLATDEGAALPARVIEVTDSEVVLDANHPLAGHDMTVDFKVLDVR